MAMDPQVECRAIEILASEGHEKYCEFLESKGSPDFLSSEEVAAITLPGVNVKAICDRIKSRSAGVSAFVAGPSGGLSLKNGEYMDVIFNPPMGDVSIGASLYNLMQSAEKEIQVAMYTFNDAGLFTPLYKQAEAGCVVDIVLDKAQASYFTSMLKKYSKNFPNQPKSMFIRIATGVGSQSPGCMHEKYMVVDSKNAFMGSYNFTWSAANINREVATFMVTKAGGDTELFIKMLQQQQEMLDKDSVLYTWPNK